MVQIACSEQLRKFCKQVAGREVLSLRKVWHPDKDAILFIRQESWRSVAGQVCAVLRQDSSLLRQGVHEAEFFEDAFCFVNGGAQDAQLPF